LESGTRFLTYSLINALQFVLEKYTLYISPIICIIKELRKIFYDQQIFMIDGFLW